MKKTWFAILGSAVILSGCFGDAREQYIGCWGQEDAKLPSVVKIEFGPGGKSQLKMHQKSFPDPFFHPRRLSEQKVDFKALEGERPYVELPMMGRIEMVLHENKNIMSIADKTYKRTNCSRWDQFDQEWEKEYARRESRPRFKM